MSAKCHKQTLDAPTASTQGLWIGKFPAAAQCRCGGAPHSLSRAHSRAIEDVSQVLRRLQGMEICDSAELWVLRSAISRPKLLGLESVCLHLSLRILALKAQHPPERPSHAQARSPRRKSVPRSPSLIRSFAPEPR